MQFGFILAFRPRAAGPRVRLFKMPDCYGCILTLSGIVGLPGGTALRSGDESSKKPGAARASDTGAKVQSKDRDMGAALRTVYQRTVEEAIPPEMLDLLGKLD